MKRSSFPGSRTALLLLAFTLPALAACSNEPTAAAPTALPPALPSATTLPTSEPTLPPATTLPTSEPTLPPVITAPTSEQTLPPATTVLTSEPALPTPSGATTEVPIGQPGTTIVGDAPQEPAASGVVERIDGQTLVIKQMRGASVTVQLSADTTLQMAVDIQPSDIQVGDPLTAIGTKNGQTLEARQILIGQAWMFGGAPRGGAQLQRGGAQLQMEIVSGTVEQIAGETIHMQAQDGSTFTVQLTAETQVQKMQDIQASEIQVGAMAIVFGSQNGDVVQATRVEILSRRQR